MIRSRSRVRAVIPWQYGYKADGIDPTLILQLTNQRQAVNNIPRAFTDIFSISRASSKWVFNSSGVLTEVLSNQPAYDYNPVTGAPKGILIEGLRTNLALNSNANGGSSVAGYGGVTATKIRQETRKGVNGILLRISGTATLTSGMAFLLGASTDIATTTGHTFTFSLFSEVIENRGSNIPTVNGAVRTLNGATTVDTDRTALDMQLSSGFVRRSGTFTTDQATTTGILPIIEVAFVTGNTYDFDIWVGGLQIEEAAFASSYIPTAGAVQSRAADVISNGSGNVVPFASWYNQTEGTFVVSANREYSTASSEFPRLYTSHDGTFVNGIFIFLDQSGSNFVITRVRKNSVYTQDKGFYYYTAGQDIGIVQAYKADDFVMAFNGSKYEVDVSGEVPSGLNQLSIGSGPSNSNPFFGHIYELRYYPIKITPDTATRLSADKCDFIVEGDSYAQGASLIGISNSLMDMKYSVGNYAVGSSSLAEQVARVQVNPLRGIKTMLHCDGAVNGHGTVSEDIAKYQIIVDSTSGNVVLISPCLYRGVAGSVDGQHTLDLTTAMLAESWGAKVVDSTAIARTLSGVTFTNPQSASDVGYTNSAYAALFQADTIHPTKVLSDALVSAALALL